VSSVITGDNPLMLLVTHLANSINMLAAATNSGLQSKQI
jgi:hypothetical protein